MTQFAQQGIMLSRPTLDVVAAFRRRVEADGGVVEGIPCLQQEITILGNFYSVFSIILTANGFKANKIYAIRPTNGDFDLTLTRATAATRRISSGDIESVATGIPRLNHRLGFSCAEFQIERVAGTNLLLRSEEVDNASSWANTNCTVVANSIAGPGAGNADAVFETVTVGQHRIEQPLVKASSALQYTLTVYIKPNGRDWVYISLRNGANGMNKWFNISTFTRGTNVLFGTWTFRSADIKDVGDGWCRIELNVTSNATNAITVMIASATGNAVGADFAGDVTKGFYVWGLQLEQGTFGTSYIPTTTAAVTRNAETLTNKTGLSSYIGSTEGTIYFKGNMIFDAVEKRITLTDGTADKRVRILFGTDHKINLFINNTTTQANITSTDVFRTDSELRIILIYAANRAALFINGVKVGEDLTVSVPSGLDRVTWDDNSTNFSGSIKVLAISPTAISDVQALALSAPASYPPVIKNIIPLTLTGNPDYYAFGNGINLHSFFADASIYIAKRGPSHYLDGGNMFGMLYNGRFNLWSSVFEVIDDGTTFYSGVSCGLVGNQIFIQVARYTVSLGVDTFQDIGYLVSVDLTTLTAADDLRLSSSWSAFTALPATTEPRYEAYGKIQQSVTTPGKYFGPWFEHDGTNHRLNVRKIICNAVDDFTITNINVYAGLLDLGEPCIVNCGGSNWLMFVRQSAGTEMIYLFSSTDDCETWSDIGETNLGSSAGDCVIDALFVNNLVYVIYHDRGTGFIYESKNNTYAQCLALALNTPQEYDINNFNDSLNGLGYPSVWEVRPGVFMKTWARESSTTEAHIYGTLSTI